MANSLRWFRKNAKVLMVVFGVGAMFIFGLGGIVSMVNPSDLVRFEGDVTDNVIARWKGGEFTRGEIQRFTHRHHQTNQFLVHLQQYAAKKKGDNFRSEAMPIRPLTANSQFNEEEIDDRVVVRLLMADKAKQEGIIIGRTGVEDYLAMVCGRVPVSVAEMKEINKLANQKQLELEHVLRHLEIELAFQQMSVLTGTGIALLPNPTEAIQYYDRTHRTVECKVLPFKVGDYLSKVTATPTESELREYYDQGKYEYNDPTGRRPGFKIGKKVRAQYFVADYNTFLENEMNKLTDEDVQKEYDQLVADGSDVVMEVVPPDVGNTDDPLPGLGEDAPKPPTEAAGQDDKPPVPPPTTATEGKDSDKATDKATDKAPDKAPDKATDKQDGGTSKDKQDKNSDQSDLSVVSVEVASQFVSIQEDDKQVESETEATASEQDADKTADSKAGEAEQKTEQEAVTPPTEADPKKAAVENETQGEKPDPTKAGSTQGNEILGPTLEDEPAIEKRARPLKDVADEIKRNLKAEDAREAVEKALSRAEAKIRVHQVNIARWENKFNPKESEKPVPLDDVALKAIADQFNLEFNSTAVVDYEQMRQEPLGKIITFVFGQDGRPVTQNVSNMIFGAYHDKEPFQPSKVEDFATRSTYLYWLAEKIDQRTPTFEEAKPSIEKYWRQLKAVDMARAEARKIADTVNQTKKPMSETYTEAVDTGGFTWFTTMGDIRYSTPIGVERPGQEFMTKVFSLKEMQAGVAANQPLDLVYAIQVVKQDEKSVEQLGDDYLNQQFFTFKRVPFDVSALSNFYSQEMNFDWMDEFTENMELEWVGR